MSTTTITKPRASAPESPCSFDRHQAAFTRAAANSNPHPLGDRVLNRNGLENRAPEGIPRLLAEIAAEVTKRAGQASLAHWLRKAAKARSNEDREVALATAREVGRLLGVPNGDFIGRGAA